MANNEFTIELESGSIFIRKKVGKENTYRMASITRDDLLKLNRHTRDLVMNCDNITFSQFGNIKERLHTRHKRIKTFRAELGFSNHKPWTVAEVFLLGTVFNDSVGHRSFNEKYEAFIYLHKKYFPRTVRTKEAVKEKVINCNKEMGIHTDNTRSGYSLPFIDMIDFIKSRGLIGINISRDRYQHQTYKVEIEGIHKSVAVNISSIMLEINSKIITNNAINNNIKEIIKEIKDYEQ